jgi:hypothetical protein
MRRAVVLTVLALLVLVPVAVACGDTEQTPTVATPDFTPKATIEIADTGPLTIEVVGGGQAIASGSVVQITNGGQSQHRLVGTIDATQVFDTATMEPGDETTVVIVPDGELRIADLSSDREVTVTVTPATD